MEKRLHWAVGKFIYARGSTHLLHFIELKDFIREDALDFSHLFFVRALRVRGMGDSLQDEGLIRWMGHSAAKIVAEVARSMLVAWADKHNGPLRVTEFYPGIGVTFEYLKFLLESETPTDRIPSFIPLEYKAYGPDTWRHKFEVLHADDGYPCRYVVDHPDADWLSEAGRSDLAIYNHNESLRQQAEPAVSLADFFIATRRSRLLVICVSMTEEDQIRTTVKGREVRLPALWRILEECRRMAAVWHYRAIADFDAGFFLPVGEAPMGLLLAYSAAEPPRLVGFEELRR